MGRIAVKPKEGYEHDVFWKHMHEGFSELRQDPEAWAAYQDETALWDSTLGDGLEDEEPYYRSGEVETREIGT